MISCIPIHGGKTGNLMDFIRDRGAGLNDNKEQEEAFIRELYLSVEQILFDNGFSQAAQDSFPWLKRRRYTMAWRYRFCRWVKKDLSAAEQVKFLTFEVNWK